MLEKCFPCIQIFSMGVENKMIPLEELMTLLSASYDVFTTAHSVG